MEIDTVYLDLNKLYSFTLPDEVFRSLLDHINNIKDHQFYQHVSNSSYDLTDEISTDTVEWINDQLELLKLKIYPDLDAKLVLTQIWVNKNATLQYHHYHTHPASIVSGIIYLNDNFVGGETIFYENDKWYEVHNNNYFFPLSKKLTQFEVKSQVKPKKGTMLLFPSGYKHSVTPVKSGDVRFTISFNTFLEGNIGDKEGRYFLNLKS